MGVAQTDRLSHAGDCTPPQELDAPSAHQRLRLVIIQETPGIWLVRGLEHDVVVEGRSIGTAVRAAIGFVQAHTAFDRRHDLLPLSAFPPAPPSYWNAYGAGTPVALSQLGVAAPIGWEIRAAVAHRRP
jgi:hypothetical protein